MKVTITNEGTSAVMGSGVAWATTPNPTTYDHMVPASGVGSGTFTVNITGLPFNTKIYARGYATNGSGTEYGNEINFTTDNIIANVTGYIYSQTAGSITYLSWNINCSTPGVVPVKFGLLGAAIGVTLKYPDHVIFQDNANSFPIIGSTYPPGLPANQRGFVVTNVGVTLLD
ncbi:MAG TPA: hypothetical protein PLK63_14460 [Catalimonadaceae bacterium]|nr:hypothetical protein [Catalimonadaceae bacterium]